MGACGKVALRWVHAVGVERGGESLGKVVVGGHLKIGSVHLKVKHAHTNTHAHTHTTHTARPARPFGPFYKKWSIRGSACLSCASRRARRAADQPQRGRGRSAETAGRREWRL